MKSKVIVKRRPKSKFPTGNAAWRDIIKTLKGDHRGIQTAHTDTHWVFKIR